MRISMSKCICVCEGVCIVFIETEWSDEINMNMMINSNEYKNDN